jgi:hypothetical protein
MKTPVRQQVLRSEFRTDEPPRDGSEIIVPCRINLKVYWDGGMRAWVLSRPVRLETLPNEITKWKRA